MYTLTTEAPANCDAHDRQSIASISATLCPPSATESAQVGPVAPMLPPTTLVSAATPTSLGSADTLSGLRMHSEDADSSTSNPDDPSGNSSSEQASDGRAYVCTTVMPGSIEPTPGAAITQGSGGPGIASQAGTSSAGTGPQPSSSVVVSSTVSVDSAGVSYHILCSLPTDSAGGSSSTPGPSVELSASSSAASASAFASAFASASAGRLSVLALALVLSVAGYAVVLV